MLATLPGLYFTTEATEARRGQDTCLRSHSMWEMTGLGSCSLVLVGSQVNVCVQRFPFLHTQKEVFFPCALLELKTSEVV